MLGDPEYFGLKLLNSIAEYWVQKCLMTAHDRPMTARVHLAWNRAPRVAFDNRVWQGSRDEDVSARLRALLISHGHERGIKGGLSHLHAQQQAHGRTEHRVNGRASKSVQSDFGEEDANVGECDPESERPQRTGAPELLN